MTNTYLSNTISQTPLSALTPDPRNARKHRKKQLDVLARAISSFGFTNPVLADKNNNVIAGHARLEAAKSLGLSEVPVIRLEHLSPEQVRAYRIADNRIADNRIADNRIAELAEWDEDMLRIEFQELSLLDLDFDLTLTGFDMGEIDFMLLDQDADNVCEDLDAEELLPDIPQVAQKGDLWLCGDHKIYCGDALLPESYKTLMGKEKAQAVFTDPPYNVAINGHVLSKNGSDHQEFAMASGEMSDAEFQDFLSKFIAQNIRYSKDGGLHYICMDWRHIYDLLHIGKQHYSALKNICVWNKSNGGMGSLYRSKHEMVAVFKHGKEPHINNVQLGVNGRYRTNVWDYDGQNSPHAERDEALAMHPTVKPTQLVADAIYDSTNRGDIVLDCFGGSGTTLIAAQQTGRKARLIECEPKYVDVTLHRCMKVSEQEPILAATNQPLSAVREERGCKEV